jgi:hypothetical protein
MPHLKRLQLLCQVLVPRLQVSQRLRLVLGERRLQPRHAVVQRVDVGLQRAPPILQQRLEVRFQLQKL